MFDKLVKTDIIVGGYEVQTYKDKLGHYSAKAFHHPSGASTESNVWYWSKKRNRDKAYSDLFGHELYHEWVTRITGRDFRKEATKRQAELDQAA